MQDKLIEAVAKAIHNAILEGAGSASDWDTTMPPEVKQIYRAAAIAAVRAHDAGTTPTAAVNYAAIDRGWRMFCQSCGTDAPCPNCEVCGALLTMVQCNDTEAGTDEGLTDARWNALCRDISDRRGLKNGWWLIDDDVKQDIRAAWSRILYAPPASHAAESAAPDTLHFCAACWAGNHGSCSGDKCGCAHDSASVSTAQLDAEDQHRAAEPVEDVPLTKVRQILGEVDGLFALLEDGSIWLRTFQSAAVAGHGSYFWQKIDGPPLAALFPKIGGAK